MRELWLIRHGETEWSRSGAHTGLSDIPLTAAGRDEATAVGRYLEPRQFALVLVSPLGRARETWEGVDELTATPGCAASTNASPVWRAARRSGMAARVERGLAGGKGDSCDYMEFAG
jgi:broad specificity phosphatase PhoE